MEDPNQDTIREIDEHEEFNTHDEQIVCQLLDHSFKNSFEHSLAEFHNSKDSTNEGNYDQLLKQLSNAKQLRLQLRNELKCKQQTIVKQALGDLIHQLQQLNIENQMLRDQHRILKHTSKEGSMADTPRVRRSINSIFPQHKKVIPEFINDSISKKSQKSSHIISKPDQQNHLSKLLKPQQANGRISLPLKRRQQITKIQMTEKKSINRHNQSINSSNCSIKNPYLHSSQLKSQTQYNQDKEVYQQHSIFNQLLNLVLLEQKIYQKDITDQINISINYQEQNITRPNKNILTVENLEKKVYETSERLEKLEGVLKMYQSTTCQVNQDLNILTNTTAELLQHKQHLLLKETKCRKRQNLIKQLNQKQIKLKKEINRSKSRVKQQQTMPQSLKAIISIIGGKKINVPFNSKTYLDEIRKMMRNPKQFRLERQNKKSKNKQLIDSIKQGRIKFKQLEDIYIGRINKLKDKISKLLKNK